MNNPIIGRLTKKIGKKLGDISIKDILSKDLKLSDLQWLFMYLFEKLSKRQTSSSIINKHVDNRFTQSSNINPRDILIFDDIAFTATENDFKPIILSPVSILGSSSNLTKITQGNIMSSVRMVELTADITTALAIECCQRRKQSCFHDDINICSSQRILRLQKFSDDLGFTPHFQMFGMCSLGKYRSNDNFELNYLLKHIKSYLEIIKLHDVKGNVNNVVVTISHMQIIESIIDKYRLSREWLRRNTEDENFDFIKESKIDIRRFYESISKINQEDVQNLKIKGIVNILSEIENNVIKALKNQFPNVAFLFDIGRITGIGYYPNICFKITANNHLNDMYPLVDGGFVNWSQKMLSNKKERLLISGFGSELFCSMF